MWFGKQLDVRALMSFGGGKLDQIQFPLGHVVISNIGNRGNLIASAFGYD